MYAIFLAGLLAFAPTAAADPVEYTEAELLAAVQEHAPERFERLMRLKDRDPERYVDALETVEDLLLQKDARKTERRAQLQSLRERKSALLQEYDQAQTDQARAEARSALEALALEHLEMKLALQQQRLDAARERLERMEAELEAQSADLEAKARQQVDAHLTDR